MNPLWLLAIIPASATFGLCVACLIFAASREAPLEKARGFTHDGGRNL